MKILKIIFWGLIIIDLFFLRFDTYAHYKGFFYIFNLPRETTETTWQSRKQRISMQVDELTRKIKWLQDILVDSWVTQFVNTTLTWLILNYNPNKVVKLKDLRNELKDGFATYKKLFCYLDNTSAYCHDLSTIVTQIDTLNNINEYFKAIVLFKYYSFLFIQELTHDPINGECWRKKNECTKGIMVDIQDDSSSYKWQCKWQYGWTTKNCKLPKFINVCNLSNAWKKNSKGEICKCITETKKVTDWINCIQAKKDWVEWTAPIGKVMCVWGRIKINKGNWWYKYQYEWFKTLSSSVHCEFQPKWTIVKNQPRRYYVCTVTDYNFSNVYGVYIRDRNNLRDWRRWTYCRWLSSNYSKRKVIANGKSREIYVYTSSNPWWKWTIVKN